MTSTSKPDERVWIARTYMNKISHRKLTKDDWRYGHVSAETVFGTWEEAHAAVVTMRSNDLRQAKAKYEAAKRSLAFAKNMKKPEAA